MPEQRHCEYCGEPYWWPKGSWQHEGCAINGAINTAINTANGETPPDQPIDSVTTSKPDVVGVDSPERRTPNRRSRESYNAYMRDYMRKRRAG